EVPSRFPSRQRDQNKASPLAFEWVAESRLPEHCREDGDAGRASADDCLQTTPLQTRNGESLQQCRLYRAGIRGGEGERKSFLRLSLEANLPAARDAEHRLSRFRPNRSPALRRLRAGSGHGISACSFPGSFVVLRERQSLQHRWGFGALAEGD